MFFYRKQQIQAQEKAKKLLKSLGITQDIKLTKYEMIIASNLVRLFKSPSASLSVFLSVSLSVYLSVCLSLSLSQAS